MQRSHDKVLDFLQFKNTSELKLFDTSEQKIFTHFLEAKIDTFMWFAFSAEDEIENF